MAALRLRERGSMLRYTQVLCLAIARTRNHGAKGGRVYRMRSPNGWTRKLASLYNPARPVPTDGLATEKLRKNLV